jgi:predicted ATPase/class 3 adenylate cyclase
MHNLPTGTVTFLFTDIEGSTRLWDEHPEAAREALARHDALVEEIVERHGGSVVRPRGEGDSRFAVFVRATSAVAAAAALQTALHDEPWPTPTPLKVRMALHTGEADLREGDYYGSAVNRCARMRSAAHGGQVLLSQVTYELVNDSLPTGVKVQDLGEHRLKDLARPERIFQLVPPGLPADFPPLKTLDVRPNNLPLQRSALVGREKLLDTISNLLMRDNVGILTLTGPGGMGKTRLSLQVAAELLEHFADGAFFVPLEPVNDQALVASTIARTFQVSEAGGRPLLEILEDYLRDKQMLLVLDNFEQVLGAGSVVSRLVGAAPGLKVLVTSRARLHVRGEHEFPVPPLSLPGPGELSTPEGMAQYEAVRLFIERAVAVKPDFEINNDNAPAVAEICARLDGLPLAIELAAARIKLLPPKAMLARLQHRLNLLVGGERDLPSRQQTLRGAIDWSYNLLGEEEQMLFRRLSVAVGGCTLQAAEAVCNFEFLILNPELSHTESSIKNSKLRIQDSIDVLGGLESLLDKSLVRQEEQEDGEPRFYMLETIREYASERLAESGEVAAVSRCHAEFFLALAEEAAPQLYRSGQLEWLDRLELEHDNLRAALDWLTRQEEVQIALRLAGSLSHFWWVRGYLTEGRKWLEDVCRLSAAEGNQTREYVMALHGLAMLCRNLGDLSCMAIYSEESVRIARQIGDELRLAWALGMRAVLQLLRGEMAAAHATIEESVSLFGKLGTDEWGRASGLLRFGIVLNGQRQYELAHSKLQEGLEIFRRFGDRWGTAQALNLMGDLARMQNDYGQAERLYEESLQLYRQMGMKRDIPASLHNLGHVALATSDSSRAREFFTESLLLHRELGNKHGVAECLAGLAGVAGKLGQPVRAARLFAASSALRQVIGVPMWAAEMADYERNLSIARAELDEQSWQQAWVEGEAMDIERAIDYALKDPDSSGV